MTEPVGQVMESCSSSQAKAIIRKLVVETVVVEDVVSVVDVVVEVVVLVVVDAKKTWNYANRI